MTHSAFYESVKERLIRYAKINTQSVPLSNVSPSSSCQKDLALELFNELSSLGLEKVYYDEISCVVYAIIPSTLLPGQTAEPFGLIAHLDTAPDAPSDSVRPWVLEEYDGGDIHLIDLLQGQAAALRDIVNGHGRFLQGDLGTFLGRGRDLLFLGGIHRSRFHGRGRLIHHGNGQLWLFQCFQLGKEPDIENAQHGHNAAKEDDQNQQYSHKAAPVLGGLSGAGSVDTVIPGVIHILIIAIVHRKTSEK